MSLFFPFVSCLLQQHPRYASSPRQQKEWVSHIHFSHTTRASIIFPPFTDPPVQTCSASLSPGEVFIPAQLNPSSRSLNFNNPNLFLSFPHLYQFAVTTIGDHRLGNLKNRNVFSHISRDQKSNFKELEGFVPSIFSLFGL
jgi:hypothetical protein